MRAIWKVLRRITSKPGDEELRWNESEERFDPIGRELVFFHKVGDAEMRREARSQMRERNRTSIEKANAVQFIFFEMWGDGWGMTHLQPGNIES